MRAPLTVTWVGAVKELAAALRREKRSVNQIRFRAVLSVARGNRVPMVAQSMSVAERAGRNWVHRYNRRGLRGLQDQRKGRQCRLSACELEKMRERLLAGARPEDGVCSLSGRDIQRILEQEFHVRYGRSSVYYLLRHQLDMSYLKPRPLHRKTDPEARAHLKNFREKRQEIEDAYPDRRIEVWFQDESRFGQQGSLTHGWAERGSRLRCWRQTEYRLVYLFGAACPGHGEAVGYLMPTANTFCMNLHLAEISQSVDSDVRVALVLVPFPERCYGFRFA